MERVPSTSAPRPRLSSARADIKSPSTATEQCQVKVAVLMFLRNLAFRCRRAMMRSLMSLSGLASPSFLHPFWHPVMKKLAPIRGELKIRTIFNLLGPLLNPANADCQLIGAANLTIARTLRAAAKQLGIRRVLVVVGSDGLDEVTLAGTTTALWSNNGNESEETWSPATFGLPSSPVGELQITDARESAERIVALFEGRTTLGLNVVLANCAAALKVLGATDDLQEGVRLARAAIESGKAMAKLNAWRTAYPQDISTKS